MQSTALTHPETHAGTVPASQAPDGESVRLAALHRLAVLDSAPEPVFDALAAAAAQVCGVPIALVSLVDANRQWFKSNVGLEGVTETPRAVAFCDHAIRGEELFEIGDARLDARFAANPLVTGRPDIRFYAGAPIVMPGGERIGTVCVIDREPRTLDAAQRDTLKSLSRIASAALATRVHHVATVHELALSEAKYRAIVEDQSELISLARCDLTLSFVNDAYARHFGLQPAEMTGRNLLEFVAAGDRDAVRDHLEATLSGRQSRSGVNGMESADGTVRWVSWINRPLLDAAGAVIGLQSVGRDITEQRLAELSLAQSQQRYRSLYRSTPAIMHSIDAQGCLLHVSDRWLEVMGYEREQAVGRPSSEFLTPESAERARASVLPAFFRTGRCDRVPYQFVRSDGSLLDVLLSAILERDADGAPFRSLAVLENITETKRLTAELGVTHARLDAIVDNVPALLAHWDVNGITRFANRQYQAALGLPLERIVGRPLQQIYTEVDPFGYGILAPHVAEVLKGRRQEFELSTLTTDGLRQLRMTLVPEQPEAGRVIGFFGMAHDVTGRKALELRLRESEQRYRSLFEHLNGGLALHEIVVDADGKPVDYRFLAMNEPFSAMVGMPAEQAIGRRVTEVFPGIVDDTTDWIGIYGAVVQSGLPRRFEHHSQGLQRWFEVVAYRTSPGQFAVIAQDITDRKLAEERLQAALEEKERLLREVCPSPEAP